MTNLEYQIKRIKESGLFDNKWYLREYTDVEFLNMDPIEHYAWIGARLRRNPSPEFDTAYYLDAYLKAADFTTNPLVHYINHGKKNGLATAPPESERLKDLSTLTSFEDQETEEELRQENELLLLQLHQVQEELEKYYLKYQELKNKKKDKDSRSQ